MSMNLELADSRDDNAAAAAFHDWARNLGYKVTLRPDGAAVGIRGRYNFNAYFRCGTGMKRLIINCFFPSGSGPAEMAARCELSNRINGAFNIGTFWFDKDGDFACQFVLTFDEMLTPVLWRDFFDHVEAGVTQVIQHYAEDFKPFMA
jgi:hypothetical protein